jgi:hypothetical protein
MAKYKIYKTDGDDLEFIKEADLDEVMDLYREYDGNSLIEEWDEDDHLEYLRIGDTVVKRVV